MGAVAGAAGAGTVALEAGTGAVVFAAGTGAVVFAAGTVVAFLVIFDREFIFDLILREFVIEI